MKHEKSQLEKCDHVFNKVLLETDPYPLIVEIHPTDKCNQNCDYCFHRRKGYVGSSRSDSVLTLSDYERLFDELNSLGMREISISGGGEPLMDNRLEAIIEMLAQRRMKIRLVSNGSLIKQKLVQSLLYLDELRISVDAIRPETYACLRKVPGRMLSRVMHGLDAVIKAKQMQGYGPELGVTFLVRDENIAEVQEFTTEMLKRDIDKIVFKQDIYSVDLDLDERLRKILLPTLFDPDRVDLRPFTNTDSKGIACVAPYFKVAFNPYGDLFSCCLASQPRENNGFLLGNYRKTSFAKLWGQSKLIRLSMINRVSCNYCNITDYQINAHYRAFKNGAKG